MFTAFSNFIVYKAPDDSKIREVTFWTLGSVASAQWEELIPVVVTLIPGFLCMYAMSSAMNALLMGESSAVTLGVSQFSAENHGVFICSPDGNGRRGDRKHWICRGLSSHISFDQ